MAEHPPPPTGPAAGPPAGWYSDPGGGGLRWWDGAQWTDAQRVDVVSDDLPSDPNAAAHTASAGAGDSTVPPPPTPWSASQPAPMAAGPPSLMPVGEWLSRSFRLTVGSLGGYLPLILLVVIPWFMALAVAAWYGLRDGVMVTDFETGAVEFQNLEGRLPILTVSVALLVMLFFGLRLLYTYASRNMAATFRRSPSDPSDQMGQPGDVGSGDSTLGLAARRWPAVTGVTLIRTFIYVVLYLIGWAAVVLSEFMVLLAPVVVAAMAWFWSRHVLSNASVSAGKGWRQSFDDARAITAGNGMRVFGRLVALTIVGFSLILVANTFGSLAAAISGSQPDTPVEPFADTVMFNDLFPSNPAALALSWVFLAIGVGAWQILSATAHTLLYLDLKGELDLAAGDGEPAEPESGRY